jgi:carbon monoxide dehydrogenase subunit G
MQFENQFEVSSPIDTVWNTLLDVEQVAPCMPGAEVLEQTGDSSYKVSIKVRMGPVSMQYRGDVHIVDPDNDAHIAKLVAKATEARGQGTANAEILMKLSEQDGKTQATLTTDLRMSGRAAAMGQGIVKDVASKLTETFADCLAQKLSGNGAEAPEAPAESHPETKATPVVNTPPEAGGAELEQSRDATQVLDAGDVEAALKAEGDAQEAATASAPPPPPPPPKPQSTPPVAAELNAADLAKSVAVDRLRQPKTLIGIGAVLLLVLFLRRRR